MLRLVKNIAVLLFILCLPLAIKFYYAAPDERAFYLSWIKQQLNRPPAETLTEVKEKILQATPETLQLQFIEGAEGFQQIANCGKTETAEIPEQSAQAIYRWTDAEGQVHFSDKEPGALGNSARMSINYPDRKRYFNLNIIEDTRALPAFTRDKVSADMRQIYGILSRDMALDHLRQVQLNIRIIESQEAFQRYKARVAPQISTNSGFYTGKDNEAVVFQDRNEQQMLAVVRHEATHVLVAGLYGYSPVWFNEGLAEYFEHLKLEGQLRQVQPAAYHLAYLRSAAGQLPALRSYVEFRPKQWYGGNLKDHYALAWSLIYFLMSGNEGRQLLKGMMNRLAENYCRQFSSLEYIEMAYPGGFAALEQNWHDWLARDPTPHRY